MRNTEIRCINYLRQHCIRAAKRQIRGNLLPHTHLIHSRDIFHYKRHWERLLQYIHEFSVQRISRVFDNPDMVANLGEGLARWAAYKHVGVARYSKNPFLDIARTNIASDYLCLWKIDRVGRGSIRIIIRPGNNRKTSLAEPLRKTSSSGKEIDDRQPAECLVSFVVREATDCLVISDKFHRRSNFPCRHSGQV